MLLQAVEFFINNYELDARYLTASIIAAVVLLPAAVIWNWRHGEEGQQAVVKSGIGAYAVSALATVAAVFWYWTTTTVEPRFASREIASARSVAVMPFENGSEDADVQYLCDGIAESLVNWLATVPDMKVISKSASFRMRDGSNDTAKIAAALGVDSIIRGRLERVGERIVISAS